MIHGRIVLTGASSAGKSTLLAEMARRGYRCVPEPGRRVLRSGGPDPWDDPVGFAEACFHLACQDHAGVPAALFDRSAIDAAINLEARGAAPPGDEPPYSRTVFVAEPWPEIYVTDAERRHGLDSAESEYRWLCDGYRARGHELVFVPKLPLPQRSDWFAAALARLAKPL